MIARQRQQCDVITLVTLVLLSIGSTRADTIEEFFDTDPGWQVFNLPLDDNDFGFRESAFAGASPGEAGGYFSASGQLSWYGDTTIGNFTANDAFRASGLMNIHTVDEDYNNTIFVGHFDSDSVSVGDTTRVAYVTGRFWISEQRAAL